MRPELQPARRPTWLWLGLVAALGLLPALHFAAVDFEDKTATPDAFLAQVADRHASITLGGTFGLVLTTFVIAFLLGLRTLATPRHRLTADVLTTVGLLGVIGLTVSAVRQRRPAWVRTTATPTP